MNTGPLYSKYLKHKHSALLAMIAVCILITIFRPWRASGFDLMFLVFMTMFFFIAELRMHMVFSGYGVAKKLNALTGENTFGAVGEMALWDFAPKALFMGWGSVIVGYPIAWLIAQVMARAVNDPWFSQSLTDFANVLLAARLLSLSGVIYVWLLVDRIRFWRVDETSLHATLERKRFPADRILEIVSKAREQGLTTIL